MIFEILIMVNPSRSHDILIRRLLETWKDISLLSPTRNAEIFVIVCGFALTMGYTNLLPTVTLDVSCFITLELIDAEFDKNKLQQLQMNFTREMELTLRLSRGNVQFQRPNVTAPAAVSTSTFSTSGTPV